MDLTYKIRFNNRACKVGNEFAYFHCWEHYSRPIEASPLVGGPPAGVFSKIYGIVEFKDCVKRVDPVDIVFCDETTYELEEWNEYMKGEDHEGQERTPTDAAAEGNT